MVGDRIGYCRILDQLGEGGMGVVYRAHDVAQSRPDLAQVTDAFWRLPGMAMVHYSRGRRAESDRALSTFIEKYQTGGAHNVAQVYAFRGEADEAFQWLERAYAQHDGGMFLVKVDPLLENLRTDSRFEAVLRKLHLSAQASESRRRSRSPWSPNRSSRTSD